MSVAMSESARRSHDQHRQSARLLKAERDGVVIVTLGALGDPLPAQLVEQLEALIADRPVIIDLTEIILVSAAPAVGLAGWIISASQHPDQCCLVCPRATARALLRKWHVTRCLAVFGSIGDALQARRFDDEGYGVGWHHESPGRPGSEPSVDCLHAIVERFEKHKRRSVPAETLEPCNPAVLGSLETEGLITTQPDGWTPTLRGLRKIDALTHGSDRGSDRTNTHS
jgi:hypothetical protein